MILSILKYPRYIFCEISLNKHKWILVCKLDQLMGTIASSLFLFKINIMTH